ncbi:MAG: hypothetical protein EON95_06645 [Caulobacteraceae bacterium]|nr:hypothetical protein [Caulobacter sp.]RYF94092.1 MAG: hypothetical protein EON95_06645 [Caulobacteraceae bacterium]
MLKRFAAGLSVLAILGASPAPAAAQTEVSEVEIVNDNSVILRVEVTGALGPKTVVMGDVPGLNCGAEVYKYTDHEVRQCWVWVRRGFPIKLTAKGMRGPYGEWTVKWQGCEVADGGAACRIAPPEKETQVAAHFTGTPEK